MTMYHDPSVHHGPETPRQSGLARAEEPLLAADSSSVAELVSKCKRRYEKATPFEQQAFRFGYTECMADLKSSKRLYEGFYIFKFLYKMHNESGKDLDASNQSVRDAALAIWCATKCAQHEMFPVSSVLISPDLLANGTCKGPLPDAIESGISLCVKCVEDVKNPIDHEKTTDIIHSERKLSPSIAELVSKCKRRYEQATPLEKRAFSFGYTECTIDLVAWKRPEESHYIVTFLEKMRQESGNDLDVLSPSVRDAAVATWCAVKSAKYFYGDQVLANDCGIMEDGTRSLPADVERGLYLYDQKQRRDLEAIRQRDEERGRTIASPDEAKVHAQQCIDRMAKAAPEEQQVFNDARSLVKADIAKGVDQKSMRYVKRIMGQPSISPKDDDKAFSMCIAAWSGVMVERQAHGKDLRRDAIPLMTKGMTSEMDVQSMISIMTMG
jgi:hypothetical protein